MRLNIAWLLLFLFTCCEPAAYAVQTTRDPSVVKFTAGVAASSTTTGTVQVTGGVGISGAAYIGGVFRVTDSTTSTSTSSGAVVITGGLGVGGPLFGASLNLSGLTASRVVATDGSKNLSSATTTLTQVNYLGSATGTTGTTSSNVVFSASPTFSGTVTLPSGTVTSSIWNTGASELQTTNITATAAGGYSLILAKSNNLPAMNFEGGATNDFTWSLFSTDSIGLYKNDASTAILTANQAGVVSIPTTTDATSAATGALVISGGIGTAKVIWTSTNVVALGGSSNPATTGAIRMANGTSARGLGFRNAANSGNHTFFLNTDDKFEVSSTMQVTGYVNASEGISTRRFGFNSSNPPTNAEITAQVGAASSFDGYVWILDDANGHANEYIIWSDGTKYWYATGTAAP